MTREERRRARLFFFLGPFASGDISGYLVHALDLLDRLDGILGDEFAATVCATCTHRCAVCDDDDGSRTRDVCRVEHARKAMEGGPSGPC